MKTLVNFITTIRPILALAFLAGFALLPKAEAVIPAPDGCYPNFTTVEGCDALDFLTTGAGNTALGWRSLFFDSTGSFNTGVGGGALALNNADSNTALGAAALLLNTAGIENTANGTDALVFNDTGSGNTAVGAFALFSNIANNNNTAIGDSALFNNIAEPNTAVGYRALFANTTGVNNTATGYRALESNVDGFTNTAVGTGALENNTSGSVNTAIGYAALDNNTEGVSNTAIGRFALVNNDTGNLNTALGRNAGSDITGSGNVCIGANVPGEVGVDDSTYIRNVNTLTQNFAAGVNDYVTVRLTDGRLGHTAVVSSRRYKQDIKPLASTSEVLYALKPVSFRLKKEYDETQALGFGLIAEEVEKVDSALVYHNAKGQVESVRYEMVNAMLLNEFLKEHKKVQTLEGRVASLTAMVQEQSAQIQKVSAQLGMRTPAAKVVVNKP